MAHRHEVIKINIQICFPPNLCLKIQGSAVQTSFVWGIESHLEAAHCGLRCLHLSRRRVLTLASNHSSKGNTVDYHSPFSSQPAGGRLPSMNHRFISLSYSTRPSFSLIILLPLHITSLSTLSQTFHAYHLYVFFFFQSHFKLTKEKKENWGDSKLEIKYGFINMIIISLLVGKTHCYPADKRKPISI